MREGFNRRVIPRDERVEQSRRKERDVDLMKLFGAGEQFAERLGAFGGAAHVIEKFSEAAFGAGGAFVRVSNQPARADSARHGARR